MSDLAATWDHARAGLAWPDFSRLLESGVPRNITGKLPSNGALAIGADDIAIKDGRWERRFRGDRAVILPVWGWCPDEDREMTVFEREAEHVIETFEHTRATITAAVELTENEEIRSRGAAVLNLLARNLEKAERRANEIYRKASMEVIDLVAFRQDTPRSFWAFAGDGMLLGKESLDRAQHYQEPLTVHECPLDWLRAGCNGVVILDWKHYWPAYLSGIPALRTATVEFGRRLSAKLHNPFQLPEIQVAE